MRRITIAVALACLVSTAGWSGPKRVAAVGESLPPVVKAPEAARPTPEEALQRLIDGNERFVQGANIHPDESEARREAMIAGQKPFAAILGCSDSRAPPEIIFDQGLGDLFVIRVAGNVAGPVEVASIDYAALYLGASIVVVLGHQNCGAIKAVVSGQTEDIEAVADLISPCVAKTENLEEAIQFNAEMVAAQLKANPALYDLIRKNKLKIVGAYYNFETGKVKFFLPDLRTGTATPNDRKGS
jgi:carbonic anhydrase